MPDDARWNQFRRLLLGSTIEALQASGVNVRFETIAIRFSDRSAFRVPRLDNYMRFHGEVEAELASPDGAARLDALRQELLQAWPEILSVVDLPIGDRLTSERNHITVQAEGSRLCIGFDLEAD